MIFLRAVEKINSFVKSFIGILLIVMSGVIVLQVIFRLLRMALPWSEELTKYLMEYVVFWGMAYVFFTKGHMIVNIIVDRMPARLRKVWDILIYLFLIVFFVVIIRMSYLWIYTTRRQVSAAMQIPLWTVFLSVPTGCLLAILNCIYQIVVSLKKDGK